MIVVDRLLRQRGEANRPVRVGMVGAGFMGQGIANQILNYTPGMDLVAICSRDPDRARGAYRYAGVEEVNPVTSPQDVDAASARGRRVVTDDPTALTRADSIDVVLEVTGTVEHAAGVVLDAMDHGKHVVLMNAELDATLGPYLKVLADRAGVVYTAADGDQPGVQGNLVRFVLGLGLESLVVGNLKGLQDEYRTPTTQASFAERWGQNAYMVTSFADGTKISFEQAIVANAYGLTITERGMRGSQWDEHVDAATATYDVDELRRLGGVVDYLVGARPSPGVFVFAACDDPRQQHYLELYKLGPGPLYSFYTPYHLCHFETPASIARAVLLGDPTLQPGGAPQVEVVARAKRELRQGDVLDGFGGYDLYGVAERADVTASEELLPMGVAPGCELVRDLRRDDVLTYEDVRIPPGRLVDRLRLEQARHFSPATAPA